MKRKLSVWFALGIIVSSGCGVGLRDDNEAPVVQHASDTVTKYSYEISNVEEERIRKGCSMIQRGDGYERIVSLIGKPQHDNVLRTKEGQFRERVLRYYFKRVDKELVNEKFDKLISLHLDAQGRLQELSSNVEGIESWR